MFACRLIILMLLGAQAVASECKPLNLSRDQLEHHYQTGFSEITQAQIPAYLASLLPCLSQLDPFLRDQIGYEATATLLRKPEDLSGAQVSALRAFQTQLIEQLKQPDESGVTHPFIIIVLAEVARTDRIHDWMHTRERAELINVAVQYLTGLTDYRAFEDGVGFRHGVAHGADLVLQLTMNPNIEPDQLVNLVAAIESQIVPGDGSAYIAGEPGRLARAVFFLIQRSGTSELLRGRITELIATVKNPKPYDRWYQAFKSEAGLKFRHNRRAFAEALYVQVMPYAGHEVIEPFVADLNEMIKDLP